MEWLRSWRFVFAIGVVAFLAFLARAFIDWRFVFPDFVGTDDPALTLVVTAIYVALAAAWIWALLATFQRRRGGVIGVLVLSLLLLVGIGIATPTAFCPSPCDTVWPWGWELNWAGLVIGAVAAVAALARLTMPRAAPGHQPS
jgi:hypothetical protein